jgi:hypothetical protein
MNRQLLIELAEESGILIKDDELPYSMPAHQRFISRLMNLSNKIERATEEKIADRFEDAEIKRVILGGE